MTRRNSPHLIQNLDDLSHLDEMVEDKRLGQRSAAKKNRRNRHYEKQFIRNAMSHRAPLIEEPAAGVVDRSSEPTTAHR